MDPLRRLSPRCLFIAFCTLVILCTTFSAANPVIKITPEKFTVGITQILNVGCTFNKGDVQTFTNLYSLAILHAKENSGHHFSHLVSVRSDHHIQYGPVDNNMVTATGTINVNGVSYINVTMRNPKEDRAGVYKCVAQGANSIGRPVSSSSTANAEAISPTVIMAISEINNIKKELIDLKFNLSTSEGYFNGQIRSLSSITNNLQQQIYSNKNQFSFEMGTLKSSVNLLQNRVSGLESLTRVISVEQYKTKSSIENAKQSMFIPSSTAFYNGRRRYWLTRYSSSFNPGYAQSTCQLYGGYLAELDTHGEYSFVRDLVKKHRSSYKAVILGGTDEEYEGRWLNRHSNTPVASFWHSGQPDNYDRNEHCSCLWQRFQFAMNDCPCYHVATDNIGFVCEIPE